MTVSKSENTGRGTRDTAAGQENINFDFTLAPEELTDNAKVVLAKRYLKRDGDGTPLESPDDLFRRVAGNIAQAEKKFGGSDEKISQTAELISTSWLPFPSCRTRRPL